MLTEKEMDKQITNYCVSVVLKSDISDWVKYDDDDNMLVKYNIVVLLPISSSKYHFIIHDDNKLNSANDEFYLKLSWFSWFRNKKTREQRKNITREQRKNLIKKHKEIILYFKNKDKYEKTLRTYNSLSTIKEIRRQKLKDLTNDSKATNS